MKHGQGRIALPWWRNVSNPTIEQHARYSPDGYWLGEIYGNFNDIGEFYCASQYKLIAVTLPCSKEQAMKIVDDVLRKAGYHVLDHDRFASFY